MDLDYQRLAAYTAGLAATLLLARYLTPARWWRRPTLRNLAIAGLGAWVIGAMLIQTFGAAPVAAAAPPAAAAAGPVNASGADAAAPAPFRVHRDLNLRSAPGTQSALLAVIPAGATVAPTGERDGDWWRIAATVQGRQHTGWSSSLWLRKQSE